MRSMYLLLAAATLIAGLTPIGAAMATAEMPPLSIAFVRFGAAGILLAATMRYMGLRFSLQLADWPLVILLALICVPINQLGFLVGIHRANAAHAGIAYALVPMLVYWTSLVFGLARWRPRMMVASALAFLGAAVVVLSTAKDPANVGTLTWRTLSGDLLLFSAVLSWALFLVLSQPMVRDRGAIQTLTAVFLVGAVLQIPVVAADYQWFELRTFHLSDVTWKGWAGLAYITVITAYANYLIWYRLISRHDATRSTVVTNSSFIITVSVQAIFFGGAMSWWVVPGSMLLLVGIVLANVQRGIGASAGIPPTKTPVTDTSVQRV